MAVEPKNQIAERSSPMTVAWISDFPIEWMPDLPLPLQSLPKQNPGTWQMVLLSEFKKNPALRLHIIVLRKKIDADLSFERNGVTFHILKVPGGIRAPSLFWVDTFLIKRALKKIKPDLVHAWGMEKGAASVAVRVGYPCIVTVQGLFSWMVEVVPVANYVRFIAMLEKISFKRIKMATTESAFAVQYLKNKYPELQIFQAEHAPNPLFHHVQRQPQIRPVRFVFVGTLSYAKGTDLLLRALNEFVSEFDFELVLISGADRTYLDSLRDEVSPELWQRITLKTNLSSQEVANEMAIATQLLFPTRVDTSPNAVKEAVVAGVPVVGAEIGGIPDYVFPGKNGLLFPSNSLDQFIEAIRTACQHPLFGRGKVDETTLREMRKYLSPQTMGHRFFEVYKEVIEK